MRSGQLKYLITFQSETFTQTDSGQQNRSWVTLGTAYADITPQRGSEKRLGLTTEGKQQYQVTIRPFTGLTQSCRILWASPVGQKTMSINSIVPTPKQFDIIATEVW